MNRFFKLCVALTAMYSLVGCGHRGDLERPPPIWGKNKIEQSENSEQQSTGAKEDKTLPEEKTVK